MIPGCLSRHGGNGPGICRYYRTDTVFISSVAGQFIRGNRTIHPGRSDNSSGAIGQSDLRESGAAGNRSFIACRAARNRSMWSAAPFCLIRGRDHTLDVVGRSFLPDPRPEAHSRGGTAAPSYSIRGRILPAAPHSRSFFEAGCIDFLKKVKLGVFLRKIRLLAPTLSPGRSELCLK